MLDKLIIKLLDNTLFDNMGKIKKDEKFKITIQKFKIKNSKIIGNPDDKFKTFLFLPEGEGRKGEGGLRTKGYFKFSYVKHNEEWWISDFEGNPLTPTPGKIQEQISSYIRSLPAEVQTSFNKFPLITVITVVFNGEKYLEQTIQSVINQTYPNVEYIIIDGGSTDGTLDIIKKYEDYIDYWVSERDKGIYDAMNKGIDLASGDWINFMNAGDRFYNENTIYEIVKLLNKNKDYEVIYGDCIVNFGNYKIEKKAYKIFKIKYYMPFNHQTVFTKTLIAKYKKFNILYKLASDYDFFLSLYKNGGKFLYANSIVSEVSVNGVSDKNRINVRREYYQIQKKNDMTYISNTLFFYYIANLEIIKKIVKLIIPEFFIKLVRKI